MRYGFSSEKELVVSVIRWLGDHGYEVTTEVPNLGQSVDVVAQRKRLFLIEAKRVDWKRAFSQCRTHEHVADAIWLALPVGIVSAKVKLEAVGRGYGVIGVEAGTGMCRVLVMPRTNKRVWLPQRAQFLRHLKEIKDAD